MSEESQQQTLTETAQSGQPGQSGQSGQSAQEQIQLQQSLQNALQDVDNVLQLPLMKIKRICKSDADYILQASQATVVAGLATQLFVEKFTEDALLQAQVRNNKRGASNLPVQDTGADTAEGGNTSVDQNVVKVRMTYEDLSQTVAKDDKYSFLQDIIPKQKPLVNLVRENKIRYSVLENGQQMLNFQSVAATTSPKSVSTGSVDDGDGDENKEGGEDAQEEVQEEDQEGVQEEVEEITDDDEEEEGQNSGNNDGQHETGLEDQEPQAKQGKELELLDFGIDNSSDEDED